jgi:hypothetical protein
MIRETISQNTLPKLAQDTQVEIGQLDGNSILLGASALLANNYALLFNPPLPREQEASSPYPRPGANWRMIPGQTNRNPA